MLTETMTMNLASKRKQTFDLIWPATISTVFIEVQWLITPYMEAARLLYDVRL